MTRKPHRPHWAVAVLGDEIFPPMQLPFGGADNFFPKLNEANAAVWGGNHKACPEWLYGDSFGNCSTTGDPSRFVVKKLRFVLRALAVFPANAPGLIRVREWHSRANQRHIRFELPCGPGIAYNFDLGPLGVDLTKAPFIETTVEARIQLIYDIA